MTLYDRVAATPGGPRRLADARLRHDALHLLWQAQAASKLSVEQLAAELGVRRRAVRRVLDGNGDISVGTLGRCLHAMGYEVEMRVVAAGEPRRKVVEGRDDYGAAVSAPLTDGQAAALRQDLADGTVPRRKATVLDDDAQ